MANCTNCGNHTVDTDRFCTSCGAVLAGVPPLPLAPPPRLSPTLVTQPGDLLRHFSKLPGDNPVAFWTVLAGIVVIIAGFALGNWMSSLDIETRNSRVGVLSYTPFLSGFWAFFASATVTTGIGFCVLIKGLAIHSSSTDWRIIGTFTRVAGTAIAIAGIISAIKAVTVSGDGSDADRFWGFLLWATFPVGLGLLAFSLGGQLLHSGQGKGMAVLGGILGLVVAVAGVAVSVKLATVYNSIGLLEGRGTWIALGSATDRVGIGLLVIAASGGFRARDWPSVGPLAGRVAGVTVIAAGLVATIKLGSFMGEIDYLGILLGIVNTAAIGVAILITVEAMNSRGIVPSMIPFARGAGLIVVVVGFLSAAWAAFVIEGSIPWGFLAFAIFPMGFGLLIIASAAQPLASPARDELLEQR